MRCLSRFNLTPVREVQSDWVGKLTWVEDVEYGNILGKLCLCFFIRGTGPRKNFLIELILIILTLPTSRLSSRT
jgi:hypothetical protein